MRKYRTGNKLREYFAYLKNYGRRVLGIKPVCDIEGCDKKAVGSYGPMGIPVKGTGEMKKVDTTDFTKDDGSSFDVVAWTGKKNFSFIWECEKHI